MIARAWCTPSAAWGTSCESRERADLGATGPPGGYRRRIEVAVSLRARVALLVFVLVVAGVGLAIGGGYWFAQRELHQEVDEFLARRARQIVQITEQPEELSRRSRQGVRPLLGAIAVAEFDALVQILDGAGRPVFFLSDTLDGGTRLPVDSAERRLAAEGGEDLRRTVRLDGQRYRLLTAPLPQLGAVQIARALGETDRALNDLLRRTIPLGAVVAAVAAAGAWLLARRALKPVARLTGAAEHVARTQDLAAAIEVSGDDEVGRLARSFNAMLAALATSRRQQQRLVADAGHELRTPLTSVRANIELLQRAESLDEAERRRILADADAEIRQLSELVRELVDLAGEAGADAEPVEALDLAELAAGAASRARRRTGRDVVVEAGGAAEVQARRGALERAVDNLVGNAAKFSPDGTPIRIVVEGRRLEVRDSGPGIPAEEQPLVFDRFFRAAGARAAPGSGLGLAIVKQVIERHGGRVWAADAPGGGAAVGFELPA